MAFFGSNEEQYARDLFAALQNLFADAVNEAPLSLNDRRVYCTGARGAEPASCVVHCYAFDGPNYSIEFKLNGEVVASGTSRIEDEVAKAVLLWANDGTVESLHANFAFVDKRERALALLEQAVFARYPAMQGQVIVDPGIDVRFVQQDRDCKLIYWGDTPHPDAICGWDECPQFHFTADDSSVLAEVVKLWVHDRAMPSALRRRFPSFEYLKVADYYELGLPVEGEFLTSWDFIGRYVAASNYPRSAEMSVLFQELRDRGYDRLLRAGQSMIYIVLSRSRRHGLRNDQASISLLPSKGALLLECKAPGERKMLHLGYEFGADLQQAMDWLCAKPVD